MTKIAVISNPYNSTAGYAVTAPDVYIQGAQSKYLNSIFDEQSRKDLFYKSAKQKGYSNDYTDALWENFTLQDEYKKYTNNFEVGAVAKVFEQYGKNNKLTNIQTLKVFSRFLKLRIDFEKKYGGWNRVWSFIKEYFPLAIVARNAWLLIVKNNILNWGKKMGVALDKAPSELQAWYESLGGDFDDLKKAIEFGRKQKMIGMDPATIATLITAGTAFIAAAATFMNSLKSDKSLSQEEKNIIDKNPPAPPTTPPPAPPTQTATASPVVPLAAAALLLFKLL
jgi:hypothetical protein